MGVVLEELHLLVWVEAENFFLQFHKSNEKASVIG